MKIEKPKQFCLRAKWRVIPFFIFFFIIVAVLLGVYRFRDTNNSSSHSDVSTRRLTKAGTPKRGSAKTSKTGWEDGRTNDRWIVISDDRQDFPLDIHNEYLCSLLEISADLEWRALVVGNNITCCRKSCVQLDDAKFKTLNYEILNSIATSNPEGRRNVGYLFAIKHGARHIFDAYLDIYISANIDIETFKREISRQLQNMALNVALGLVNERPYVKRVQNPYAHFGRLDLWTEGFRRNNQRYIHNHIYRICEVRPPSIEKFLDVDDGFFDLAAPSLTLPGSSIAPFSSKNTLYSIEAFWGLILLPAANATQQTAIPPHLLRTLWNQAVLGDIAGSIRLSLNNVTTLQRREKNRKDPNELREPDGLASFLLKWTCSTRSSLSCIRDLFQNMFQFHYISEQSLTLFENWITDLKRTHYLEPPVIPRRRGSMNPCLGADGLYGVAFYPALPPKSLNVEQVKRRNATLDRYLKEEILLDSLNRIAYEESLRTIDPEKLPSEGISSESNTSSSALYSVKADNSDSFIITGPTGDEIAQDHRHGKSFDGHGIDEMPLLREFTESTCPGYSQLLPHVTDRPLKNLLLIVAMTSLRYDMIPLFEVIYREQFQNVLYCGSPHDSIEIFLRKYQLSEDRSFSFLPVHSKYTYECLLGALEMGYNVEGWIMTTDDALINSWNVPSMNNSKLWYSGDYSIQINNTNWKSLDPGSQKLPRSLDGVLKVLEFLKSSLIGSTFIVEDHEQSESHRTKREAEITKLPTSGFSFSPSSFSHPIKTALDDIPILNDQDKLIHSSEAIQKPKFSEKTLDLHSYDGGHIFDLVELKSIVTESTYPQTDLLPSLKYDIDANVTSNTSTELNDSEHHQEHIMYKEELLLDKNRSITNVELAHTLSDVIGTVEDGQEGKELTDVYEIEEDDEERPVAEVLRKLLVATRNTTTDSDHVDDILLESTGSTEQITSTVPNQVSSEIELDNGPVEEMPIDLNADAIFDLEEDDWSKSNYTTRENPIIDLFLNPTVSTPLEGREEETNGTSFFKSTDFTEFNRNQTEDIAVQTENLSAISLNTTTESSDKSNNSDFTESFNEQLKSANATEEKVSLLSNAGEDERRSTDAHVVETLENLQEIYNLIFENLGVPIEQPDSSHYSASAYYGGDRTPYRLNPKSINQFHCERGTNLEFCKVSSEFLYQLLENGGKELKLVYDKVPTYFIPKKDQLKFYLLSNLMLQHGVTDEIAIPLILTGLSPLEDWLKLDKTYFGGLKESAKYPLFNPAAAILYPADLVQMSTDPKMQKVFCLKYLLRLLKS